MLLILCFRTLTSMLSWRWVTTKLTYSSIKNDSLSHVNDKFYNFLFMHVSDSLNRANQIREDFITEHFRFSLEVSQYFKQGVSLLLYRVLKRCKWKIFCKIAELFLYVCIFSFHSIKQTCYQGTIWCETNKTEIKYCKYQKIMNPASIEKYR